MEDGATDGVTTLVVGLDGLSRDVLSRLSPGTAPTVESLLAESACGRLQSRLPPSPPSLWTTIYTGVNPGKHGVYGRVRFDGYDPAPVDATDAREWTFWELASQRGRRSVVVNAPLTHPPATFDGVLIPGDSAPADPTCQPPGLLDEVREEIGPYRLYNPPLRDGDAVAERLADYEELIAMRGGACRYLLERVDPDLAYLQFRQCDTVFREFPDSDAAERVFEAIDEEVAATVDVADPETVILVSGHATGPVGGYEIRPNAVLRRLGFAQVAADGSGARPPSPGGRLPRIPGDPPRRVGASLAGAAKWLRGILRRFGLARAVSGPSGGNSAGAPDVDFGRSGACLRDRTELGLRINLAGREPEGAVDPDDYERVRSTLIEIFGGLRTPDGKRAFEAVLPREAVFHGPYLDSAPDVVVVPDRSEHVVSPSIRGDPFGAPPEGWRLGWYGLLAVAGPSIEPGPIGGARPSDVAPTVLATLGVPASDRMDGAAVPLLESPGIDSYPVYSGVAAGDRDTGARPPVPDPGQPR